MHKFMCFVMFLFRVDVYIRMWQLEIRLFVVFATSSRYVLLSIVCYLVMPCSTISIPYANCIMLYILILDSPSMWLIFQ